MAADELRQKVLAEHRAISLFLLGDDLQQHRTGDVLLAAFIDDAEVNALEHQPANVVQRDIAALHRIVEPPVRVLLDDANLAHAEVLYCAMRSRPSSIAGRLP